MGYSNLQEYNIQYTTIQLYWKLSGIFNSILGKILVGLI